MNFKEICSDFKFDLIGKHPYGGFCDTFELTYKVISMDIRLEFLNLFCITNPFYYDTVLGSGAFNNELINTFFNNVYLSYLSSSKRLLIAESILEELE